MPTPNLPAGSRPVRMLLLVAGLVLFGRAEAQGEDFDFKPLRPKPLPPAELILDAGRASGSVQSRIAASLAEGRLDEAETLARAELEASRKLPSTPNERSAIALANLATVHQRRGDHERAVGEYEQAIAQLAADGDQWDARLRLPWYGLGYSRLALGQHQEALPAFDSALHLHRTNLGLHDAGQLVLLEGMAQASYALGLVPAADDYQLRKLRTAERVSGSGSLAFVDAIEDLARWYRATRRPADERQVLSYGIDGYSRESKADPAGMLRLMADVIRSYCEAPRYDGPPKVNLTLLEVPPEVAINTALRLIEKNPSIAPAVQAQALMEAGNFYFIANRRESALKAWKRARAMVPDDVEIPARLGRPGLISFIPPPTVPDVELPPGTARPAGGGFVLAEFNVSEGGRVENMRVLESGPSNDAVSRRAIEQLNSALRFSRFRPRIQDDRLVRTDGVRYRYVFEYPK